MSSNPAVAIEYPSTNERAVKPKVWLPVTLMVIYWAYVIGSSVAEMPMFPRFMSQMGVLLLVGLIFLGWWLFNRRVSWGDKFLVLAAGIASLIVAKLSSDKSLGPFPIMNGMPLVLTGWALWMLLAQKASPAIWKGGLIVVIFLSTGIFPLIRTEGLTGGGTPDVHWRWHKTAEEEYLARRNASTAPAQAKSSALVLR